MIKIITYPAGTDRSKMLKPMYIDMSFWRPIHCCECINRCRTYFKKVDRDEKTSFVDYTSSLEALLVVHNYHLCKLHRLVYEADHGISFS